jgi:hypothetical protein
MVSSGGVFQAIGPLELFDIAPVMEDSGDKKVAASSDPTEGVGFLILFANMLVSIFLVKTVIGMSGSSNTVSEYIFVAYASAGF